MIRFAAAVVVALAVSPALARGQDPVFTITAATADVYKGPSNVTPVIGHVPRGRVLPVSRNLGSWIKIPWPSAPDGVGYVHVTMGRLGPASAGASNTNVPLQPPVPGATTIAPIPASEPIAPGPQHTRTVSHVIGIGGTLGSTSTVGATVRAWGHKRLGIQLGLTREAMTGDVSGGRVNSLQLEPGLIVALLDDVTDYLWIRPYLGSALSVRRQTLKMSSDLPDGVTDNGVGLKVLGGCELTSAAIPRLGVSLELSYRRFPAPFAGFETKRLGVAIAGHWYVK